MGPAAGVSVLGAAMILGALAFGGIPLFVPGVGFLVLGLVTPLWVLAAARSARVRRRLTTHRAVEEEPLEAVIEVRRGIFGLPGAQLYDPLADTAVSLSESLGVLGGRRRAQLRVVARIPRRGRHSFLPPSLSVSDALGLARMAHCGEGATDEVLVLPRTEAIRWLRREDRRSASGQRYRSTQEPTGAGEIDGLREYMPGTPASRIHWPALARGAGLLERRLVTEPQTMPLIVLDPRQGGSGAAVELLDAAVRATASLTLELARSGGCMLLLPGDRVPVSVGADLGAWPALHTRLALVEAEHDSRRGPALHADVARGPLIYVAARVDARSGLPNLSVLASQLVLVVPQQLRRRLELAPSFEVSGCAGYLLRSRARRGGSGVAA